LDEHAIFHCTRPSTQIRWGERIAVDLPVTLVVDARPVRGRLRNVSISGAMVTAEAQLPPRADVMVEIDLPVAGRSHHLALQACVVRDCDDGIGLEWRDMGCQPLVDLLLVVSQEPHPRCGIA
jgi:hypothetical protein